MIEILKKMFEVNPERSTIVLKDKCSYCGRETVIEITPTSGGFGLQGGILRERSADEYFIECETCYKVIPDIVTSPISKGLLKPSQNNLLAQPRR
jgi:hypothetical protein